MKTMDEVRNGCIDRIEKLSAARRALHDGIGAIEFAGSSVEQAWEGWGGDNEAMRAHYKRSKCEGFNALCYFAESEAKKLTDDIMAAVEQYAFLLAKDVIAPVARSSDTAVVFITGNSYMPPLREVDDAERIYQADDNGDVWSRFVEALESKLDSEHVYMASPEYDNALYVVDLKRWMPLPDGDANGDSLNDEWVPYIDID